MVNREKYKYQKLNLTLTWIATIALSIFYVDNFFNNIFSITRFTQISSEIYSQRLISLVSNLMSFISLIIWCIYVIRFNKIKNKRLMFSMIFIIPSLQNILSLLSLSNNLNIIYFSTNLAWIILNSTIALIILFKKNPKTEINVILFFQIAMSTVSFIVNLFIFNTISSSNGWYFIIINTYNYIFGIVLSISKILFNNNIPSYGFVISKSKQINITDNLAETKLNLLKQQFENGEITEAEYVEQKAIILDSLLIGK